MLEINDITKSFSAARALDSVSIDVRNSEIVAVIGPNGAGKSTLFNIIAGITTADSGECRLDSVPLANVPLSRLGFLPEKPYFYDRFTPRETLQLEQTMRRVEESKDEINVLIARFELREFLDNKMRSLSQGMAKRVALACAFIGNPEVIILDEPLNGLDIQSVISLKEQLLFEKEQGSHVLISSHVLTFLDGLVSKTVFLDKGNVVFESNDNDDIEKTYKTLFLNKNGSNVSDTNSSRGPLNHECII